MKVKTHVNKVGGKRLLPGARPSLHQGDRKPGAQVSKLAGSKFKPHKYSTQQKFKSKQIRHHLSTLKHDSSTTSSTSTSAIHTPDDSSSGGDKDDRRLEREQFVQAFEKPTQIYRWLRVRHAVNPVFLNRTLSYMRARDQPRRAAYSKIRKNFKLDDLYEKSEEEEKRKKIEMCGDNAYLNIHFTQFSQGAQPLGQQSDGRVEVSAKLTKHSFMKRKDSCSPTATVDCGSVVLESGRPGREARSEAANAADKVITLSCLNFLTDNVVESSARSPHDPQLHAAGRNSYHLELTVEHEVARAGPVILNRAGSANVDDETGEEAPPCKKRRVSGGAVGNARTSKTMRYSTELIIFDKNHKLFLEDGEYEVVMLPSEDQGVGQAMLEQRTAVWEGIFDGTAIEPFEDICRQQPTLCFVLAWSKDPGCCTEDVVQPPTCEGKGVAPPSLLPQPKPMDVMDSKSKVFASIGLNAPMLENGFSAAAAASPEKLSAECGDEADDDKENLGHLAEKPRTRGRTAPEEMQTGEAIPYQSNSCPVPLYSAKTKKPLRLFYQFSHRVHQQQPTEHRGTLCPWCELDCLTLYSLLKHLRLSHPRFVFSYVAQQKTGRIDVSINTSYDGSYAGNPQDSALTRLGYSFSRCQSVRRTPMTQVLVRGRGFKVRLPHEGTLEEFMETFANADDAGQVDNRSGYMLGHNRLYYRSTTVQPMTAADMDYDSETDSKPSWLKTKMCKLMDDFTDVNAGEKEVLKLWNLHIMEHDFTAYLHLPDLLQIFIREKGRLLLEKRLENNFLQHLVNLQDFGLIKPSVVHVTFMTLLRLKMSKCKAEIL